MSNFSLSIKKDTNRLVSTTKCSFAGVKTGSFLKLKNDEPVIYGITKISEFCKSFTFETFNSRTLKIKIDATDDLIKNDDITIFYEKYELVAIFDTVNEGKGYRVGDILKLNAVNPILNVSSGLHEFATIEVIQVSDTGGIKKYTLRNNGKYLSSPKDNVIEVIGGIGYGAKFECLFKKSSDESLEREIESISISNGDTYLYLNSNIPDGVKEGKIFLKKWELFIPINIGKDINCSEYEVIQDFTPNLKLPLLVQNSFSRDSIINKSLLILDAEITELKKLLVK